MKEKRNAKIIKTPDLLSYSARQQKKEKLPLLQQGYCFLALSTNRRIKKKYIFVLSLESNRFCEISLCRSSVLMESNVSAEHISLSILI